jgi:hypothetical protein
LVGRTCSAALAAALDVGGVDSFAHTVATQTGKSRRNVMGNVKSRLAMLGVLLAVAGCALEVEEPQEAESLELALRGSAGGGASGGGTGKAMTAVALSGTAFRVEQVEFLDDGGLSAWGALSVDPVAAARQAGFGAGFVSVRTSLGWVVHNLPIQSRPEADWPDRVVRQGLRAPTLVPQVLTYFNLGTTSALRALPMVVVFTREPLSTESALRTWGKAPLVATLVTLSQQTTPSGVLAQGPGGIPPGPPPAPPVLAPKPIDPKLGVQSWYTVTQPSEENVNSAQNQCAPAAIANGLAYLRSTFGLAVGHPNVRGFGGGPGLVGMLDVMSQRVAANTCSGNALGYCFDDNNQDGMINGLYTYLNNGGLADAVLMEHQGNGVNFPDACGDSISDPGPVSTTQGSEVTVPWIRSHLEDGDAVLLAFSRLQQTPQGEVVTSGHMLRIYGYSEVNGQAYLSALDDQQQDRMLDGNCFQDDDGLTWETWSVGDSDNDGSLNKGLNDLREVSFAIAIGVN